MQFYLFQIVLLEYLKFFNSNFFLIIDVIFFTKYLYIFIFKLKIINNNFFKFYINKFK